MDDRHQTVSLDADATAPFPGAASDATLVIGGTMFEDDGLTDELDAGPGDRIAQRYTLIERIGRGGYGDVWLARVGEGEEEVAIKLIPICSAGDLSLVRREVAALRFARLPGVVRMLDDGTDRADYFIVMERAAGAPFPGRPGPLPWHTIRPATLHLLEILARVHLSGLVHRDLKPQNVLVDAEGRCTLLDLGIAAGRALRQSAAPRAYTPRYAAPEQQVRDGVTDERTDLYSLGVMLFEALTGDLPALSHLPFADHPDVPDDVQATITRLIAPDPDERFGSALDVIDALGGQLPPLLGDEGLEFLPRDRPTTPTALRRLFHGPELFFHLPEDAADELWRRTGGHAEHIEAELGAWLRAGVAYWDEDRIRIDREAIERLQSGLRLRVDTPADTDDVFGVVSLCTPHTTPTLVTDALSLPADTVDAALDALRERRLIWSLPGGCLGSIPSAAESRWPAPKRRRIKRTAMAHLPEGALKTRFLIDTSPNNPALVDTLIDLVMAQLRSGALRDAPLLLQRIESIVADLPPDPPSERDLLKAWVIWALSSREVASIEHVLLRLEQQTSPSPLDHAMEAVLRANMACLLSQFHRAIDQLSALPTIDDEDIEEWKNIVLVRAYNLGRLPERFEFIEELKDWSLTTPRRRALYLDWQGTHHYHASRFEQAAEAHFQASILKTDECSRISSLLNSAVAYLEALDFTRSTQLAHEVIALTAHARNPTHESIAQWVIRTCQHRTGDPKLTPCMDFIEAATSLESLRLFAITEAPICWRSGDIEGALFTLSIGRRIFTQDGFSQLLHAFQIYLTESYSPDLGRDLYEVVLRSGIPDFIVQTVALLCYFEPENRTFHATLRKYLPSREQAQWSTTLDFFSYQESQLLSQGVKL